MQHVQIGDFKIISFGSGLPGKKSASPEGIKKNPSIEKSGRQGCELSNASAFLSQNLTSPVGIVDSGICWVNEHMVGF